MNLGMFSAVAAARNPRPVRPVAQIASVIPDAPLWDTLTGGAGQFVATWLAVTTLVGGADIGTAPLSNYTVRWGTTEASVEAGGTPTGSTTTSSLTVTRTGLSAGTWWVSISATNGAGESDYSFPQQVTVS